MVERVTIVTGAASGIGAATVRRIAAPGEGILLHARGRNPDGLDAVAETARQAGAEVEFATADFAEPGAAAGLPDAAVAWFVRLDRLVSNAGYALRKPVGELEPAELRQSLEVVMMAFNDLAAAALPHLTASGQGRIVAVSSFVAAQVPGGYAFPATAAAKGALEGYVRTLAVQVAADGITVNCVAPGFTRKDPTGHAALKPGAWDEAAAMTPNGRIATPADIAAAIAFFLSAEAEHITGQVLRVDGGLSLI